MLFNHSMFRGMVFIFLSFFLIIPVLFSQGTCDTLQKNTEVKWRYFHQLTSFSQKESLIDIENIKGFQHYEFPRRTNFFIATKGNIGHSTRNLEFSPKMSDGFNLYGVDPFFGNNFFKNELPFYEPEHVFTDLFYVSGPNREQTFNVLHNQRLSESLVLGLSYRVLNSPGRYSRSASANTNWYVNLKFDHPEKPYGFIGGLIINRVQNQESGGLKDRLGFEANNWNDAGFLANAELRDRDTNIFFHQFLKISNDMSASTGDSLHFSNSKVGSRLFHEFSFSQRSINFLDKSPPEPSFFGLEPINLKETHDSTKVSLVENSMGILGQVPLFLDNGLFFKAFVKHRFARITQNVLLANPGSPPTTENFYDFFRNSFSQIIIGGEAQLGFSKSSTLKTDGSFVALGKNIGDFGISSVLTVNLPDPASELTFNVGMQLRDAPYFLSRFLGNYVLWINDFDKERILNAGAGFKNGSFELKVNTFLLKDMVFVGHEATPIQNPETFGMLSLRGGVKKAFGAFNTGHDLLFQYAGTEKFESFPFLTSYHTFFFEFSLFKKAMFLNVGVDLFFNTPYKPMGFMPVVRQFYSQSTYQSNHIVTADIFGTFRIDKARLFLKLQNIGSQIPEIPMVYHIPFYPLQDFAIKFGVSWLFFD